MLTGVLALFATLVTRAGGAWASSVHTFVVEAEGSAPTDAYGRIVALAIDAGAGVEVMAYLMVMLLLFGWWLADLGLRLDGTSGRSTLIAVTHDHELLDRFDRVIDYRDLEAA